MRFSLIPKSNGRKIVATSIGVAMFDRHANLFFKDDRVLDVETVDGYRVHPVRATAGDDAMVKRRQLEDALSQSRAVTQEAQDQIAEFFGSIRRLPV